MSRATLEKARQRSKRPEPEPKATIDIVTAISDPAIFGDWFRDRESWAAWVVVLKMMFGIALQPAELATFQRHTGRTTPSPEGYFDVSLIAGRRAGKSLILATIAAYFSAFYDWRPFLTGGERATVMIIAADRRQAGVIFKYLQEMLSIPLLRGIIQRETNELLELSNGVTIEIATASFRTLRGRTVVLALADELAFWMTDSGVNPDTEIIAALTPAMATIPNARLLKASSPYARRGVLWRDFERHYGVEDSRTLVWKAATREMNPSIAQSIIDDAYADDVAHADAEYGANFRTDVENLFSREAIAAVTVANRLELPRAFSIQHSAFCDPSGGSADSMTIAISHVEDGIVVLDAIRERVPPFSPENVVDEFCTLMKAYGISEVRGDRYGGHWPREQFSKRGIHYETSDKTTSDLYIEFLPLVNAGRVQLLDHKRLISQLVSLERRTSRTNKDTVSHPPHSHDDIATAAAGALVNAVHESQNTFTVDYDFWSRPNPQDDEIDDAAANFREAEKAFERGELRPRDVMWLLAERARRVGKR